MRANRRVRSQEDAISPIIAVILMVAITVVLAATVYLWVSGFGTNQPRLVTASFAAKGADLPSAASLGQPAGDADATEDALQILYSSGESNFTWNDVTISIDGTVLTGNGTSTANAFVDSATTYCSSLPGGRSGTTKATWERGEAIYVWKANGATCATAAASPGLLGTHSIQVSGRGQILLDTSLEIKDDLKT